MKSTSRLFVASLLFAFTGALFVVTPARAQTFITFYAFTGAPAGIGPAGTLIRDARGNLYGTTVYGGNGGGTVFKLDTSGNETVVYSFCTGGNCPDGAEPYAGVVRDARGNLYGTTQLGGDLTCSQYNSGCGVVFKVDPSGHESVLHAFTDGTDGGYPMAGLNGDGKGNLYGTAAGGGDLTCSTFWVGCGTVFEISPK
jgi:uncharacterized repeat protein (TIGR03803 family)